MVPGVATQVVVLSPISAIYTASRSSWLVPLWHLPIILFLAAYLATPFAYQPWRNHGFRAGLTSIAVSSTGAIVAPPSSVGLLCIDPSAKPAAPRAGGKIY